MKITLNGKEREIPKEATLQHLIEQFCKDPAHVIAELNGSIIKKDQWTGRTIQDRDTLELVNFVGGG